MKKSSFNEINYKKRGFSKSSTFAFIFMIVAICLDSSITYLIFRDVFRADMLSRVIASASTAIGINMLPALMSVMVRDRRDSRKDPIFWIVLDAIVYLLLMGILLQIRLDLLEHARAQAEISSQVAPSMAMAIIFIALPLTTSTISAILMYRGYTPLEDIIVESTQALEDRKQELIELKAELVKYSVYKDKDYLEKLSEQEYKRYLSKYDEIRTMEAELKAYYHQKLMEILADPVKVSAVASARASIEYPPALDRDELIEKDYLDDSKDVDVKVVKVNERGELVV